MKYIAIVFIIFATIACKECENRKNKKKYYSNDVIMEEYETCDGKKDGFHKEFYKSGKLKRICYYENGTPSVNKPFKTFFPNGKKNFILYVTNGMTTNIEGWDSLGNVSVFDGTGTLYDYDIYGNRISQSTILNNEQHDTMFVWFDNNKLDYIHVFSHGKSIHLKKWDYSGDLIFETDDPYRNSSN